VTHAIEDVAYAHVPLVTQLVPFDVHVDKAAEHKESVANAKSSQIFVLHLTASDVHPVKYALQSVVSDGALSQDLVIHALVVAFQ
jgi:hypothetical protein